MKKINEDDTYAGGEDDNDSVWGGDSMWGGGDQDDFSVSVYNSKAPSMDKNSRPKAVPISRIQIGVPAASGNSEKRTPTTSAHTRKQLIPPTGKSKSSSSGPSSFHMSMGNLGSGSLSTFPSGRQMGSGAGPEVISSQIHKKSASSDGWGELNDFEDNFSNKLNGNNNNNNPVKIRSKAAGIHSASDKFDRENNFTDNARMHRSFGDLPSFDHVEISSGPPKEKRLTRRRSFKEDQPDPISAGSVNGSLSLDAFPRAAIPTEGNITRNPETSRDHKSDVAARSSRSGEKPTGSQRSLYSNSKGDKERPSRAERISGRPDRRSRSVDMSREKAAEQSSRLSDSKSPPRHDRSSSPMSSRRAIRRDRSKSPGKLKDRMDRAERKERATERKERSSRSQSPGKFRNRVRDRDGRSKSPGALSRRTVRRDRSNSPGRLSNTTSRRRATENRKAPRRTKSDDLHGSFSDLKGDDGTDGEAKTQESADEGRKQRGVSRAKSLDLTRPRSMMDQDDDESETDRSASRNESDSKSARRTRTERTKELASALKIVDNEAGSVRKTRRRADDRSYKSEGSSHTSKHGGVESRRIRSSGDPSCKKPISTRRTLMEEIESGSKENSEETVRLVKERRREEETRLERLKEEARLLEEKRLNEEARLNALKEEAKLLEEKRKDEEARMKAAFEIAKEQREAETLSLKEELELVREQRRAEEARIAQLREEARIGHDKETSGENTTMEGNRVIGEENSQIADDQKQSGDGQTTITSQKANNGNGNGESDLPEKYSAPSEAVDTSSAVQGTPLQPPEEPARKSSPWELNLAKKAAGGPRRATSLDAPVTQPPEPQRKSSLNSRLKKFSGGADTQLPPAFQTLAKAKK